MHRFAAARRPAQAATSTALHLAVGYGEPHTQRAAAAQRGHHRRHRKERNERPRAAPTPQRHRMPPHRLRCRPDATGWRAAGARLSHARGPVACVRVSACALCLRTDSHTRGTMLANTVIWKLLLCQLALCLVSWPWWARLLTRVKDVATCSATLCVPWLLARYRETLKRCRHRPYKFSDRPVAGSRSPRLRNHTSIRIVARSAFLYGPTLRAHLRSTVR